MTPRYLLLGATRITVGFSTVCNTSEGTALTDNWVNLWEWDPVGEVHSKSINCKRLERARFDTVSLHAGERLASVIPSTDPSHMGATSTGSVLFYQNEQGMKMIWNYSSCSSSSSLPNSSSHGTSRQRPQELHDCILSGLVSHIGKWFWSVALEKVIL